MRRNWHIEKDSRLPVRETTSHYVGRNGEAVLGEAAEYSVNRRCLRGSTRKGSGQPMSTDARVLGGVEVRSWEKTHTPDCLLLFPPRCPVASSASYT